MEPGVQLAGDIGTPPDVGGVREALFYSGGEPTLMPNILGVCPPHPRNVMTIEIGDESLSPISSCEPSVRATQILFATRARSSE